MKEVFQDLQAASLRGVGTTYSSRAWCGSDNIQRFELVDNILGAHVIPPLQRDSSNSMGDGAMGMH